MKNLLALVLFTVSIGFSEINIKSIVDSTSQAMLVQHVRILSGEDSVTLSGGKALINSRGTATGRAMAAEYLLSTLKSYGLATDTQRFSGGKNIIASQRGTLPMNAHYLICAHYDAISRGADDDASGCAVVLEAARLLSKLQLNCPITYVLFDREEDGDIGSYHYVDAASERGDSILGVIDIDMCGYDGDNDGMIDVHCDDASLPLATAFVTVNTTYSLGLQSVMYHPSNASSDWLYFILYGYHALCYTEAYFYRDGIDFNPNYHTANDRIRYFNLPYFLKQAKLGIGALATFANSIPPALPIQLTSFTGVSVPQGIRLDWETASEINNYEYVLSRRSTSTPFQDVVHIPGHGTTTVPRAYTYFDTTVTTGTWSYLLKQIDLDGTSSFFGPVIVNHTKPRVFGNYPNPANPSTTIVYSLDQRGEVSLVIYDILGRVVTELVHETEDPGEYKVRFNGQNLAGGVYFYRLRVGDFIQTKRLTLLK